VAYTSWETETKLFHVTQDTRTGESTDTEEIIASNVGVAYANVGSLYSQDLTRFSLAFTRVRCTKSRLRGLSPRANYTDRATAACWRSYCQLSRIEERRVVSAADSLRQYSRLSRPEPLLFLSSSPSIVLTRLSGPRSRPTTSQKIW
jgi:hypothetical protein